MRSADAIKSIVEKRGGSQRSFDVELGLTLQELDQRLELKTMMVETLCQTAVQLGCSVKLARTMAART